MKYSFSSSIVCGISVFGDTAADPQRLLNMLSGHLEADFNEIAFFIIERNKELLYANVLAKATAFIPDHTLISLTTDLGKVGIHIMSTDEINEYFNSRVLNAVYRTCILPNVCCSYEELGNSLEFPVDAMRGYTIPSAVETKKRQSHYRQDFDLKWLVSRAVEDSIVVNKQLGVSEGFHYKEDEEQPLPPNMAPPQPSKLEKMFIDDRAYESILKAPGGPEKIYSGSEERVMARCIWHKDNTPSMSVLITPFAWRKSKKIAVEEKLDRELESYYHSRAKDAHDRFYLVKKNAAKDLKTGKVYLLYSVKLNCFSCGKRK